MIALLVFIIILGLIVFVHELGHFIVAKRAGMRVEEFGFGFPPRIFGIKRGDTVYSINWIPLGGFVKIKGENGEGENDTDSFISKSLPRRAAVMLAGVTMNVVLAFVLLSFGYMIGIPQALDAPKAGAIVDSTTVRIGGVLPGSPAEKAGLKTDDVVLGMNGSAPENADALRQMIRSGSGDVKVKILRSGTESEIVAIPEILKETGVRGLGLELFDVGNVRYPWYLAPVRGAEATLSMLVSIATSFYGLIAGIFAGAGVPAGVSGPVGIAVYTGDAVKIGFRYLIEFTAFLSLNLAVLNIVPFPALDGGRFLFIIIEAIRRRPVSRRVEGIVHQVGFALLMLLILAVTYRDLLRYSGAIGGFFKGIF